MTPKEKAKELVEKFDIGEQLPYYSIKHALIAVDELIKNSHSDKRTEYWKQVKYELTNF